MDMNLVHQEARGVVIKKRKPLTLIVDDLKPARQEMMLHVDALGHDSLEAGSVQEAREILGRVVPDCILLDLQLPMNSDTVDKIEFGKSFLSEIIREHPLVPVVVVTGHGISFSHAMDVVHRSPYALVTFVPKPFLDDDPNVPNLTDSIRMVLAKAERLKKEGLGEGLKDRRAVPEEKIDVEIAVIDATIFQRLSHQQVVCLVNGQRVIVSPKEQEILAAFAKAQQAAGDDPMRHRIEVDSERFGIWDAGDNRHTTMSRMRNRRLKPYLPVGYPKVLAPGSRKGFYSLGCYCVGGL